MDTPKSFGASWVPGVVSLFAVGAPCLDSLLLLEGCEAQVCVVTAAADSANLWPCAVCPVVPELLAVEAPQRFFVERFYREGSVELEVNF